MHILTVIVEFAIVLGFLVLVHEFGHFAVAKLCGVRVEVFSIGFGTRIVGFKHGDTDYRISILPLGGYVKMAGEYGGDKSSGAPDEFTAQPRWQRMLIGFAGPLANFILSFFLLAFVAHYHHEVSHYLNSAAVVDYVPVHTSAATAGLAPGDTIVNFNGHANPTWEQIFDECELNLNRTLPITFLHDGHPVTSEVSTSAAAAAPTTDPLLTTGLIPREQAEPLGVRDVSSGSPGDRAGLKPGDAVARIDSLEIHSLSALVNYLQDHNGAPVTVLAIRNGQPITLHLTPEKGNDGSGATKWLIGFRPKPVPVDVVRLPIGAAIKESVAKNLNDSTLVLRLVKGMFTRHVSVSSLSGPVGIAQQIDIATQMGFWTLLGFISTISLQLGIFNLLPIPILDGGMILFLLVESVIRRDVNERFKEMVYQVAFVGLILFAAFVMFNDIMRLRH
ncbi:MAG: RIP metalloprotease RseP [Acidobacteriota bacterium]